MKHTLRHLLMSAVLVVGLAAPFAGESKPWITYRNPDGNFSVLLPSEPRDIASETKPVTHTLQVVEGGVGYTVIYVFNQPKQEVDEANFQEFRKGILRSLPNCAVVTEAPPSPAVPGYVGHWYRMDCTANNTKVSFIGNFYWGQHYAYAVVTMFFTEKGDPPEAKRFIDSFTVLDPAR